MLQCKYCGQQYKKLAKSHIIPCSLYKLIGEGGADRKKLLNLDLNRNNRTRPIGKMGFGIKKYSAMIANKNSINLILMAFKS